MKSILLGAVLALSITGAALASPPLNVPACSNAPNNPVCNSGNENSNSWDFTVGIDINDAVLNGQLNTSDVVSRVSDVRINSRVDDVYRSRIELINNDVYAVSAGNRVENSSLDGIVNVQINSGRIEAEVRDVTIGVRGVDDATRSSISVSGNRIGATAIGNSAINRIGE
jgi:opacity protein-like surface antigen